MEGRIAPALAAGVPMVKSIALLNPTPDSSSVDYQVSFDQPVTGVDPTDFIAFQSGGLGGVNSITTTQVGDGTVWNVNVSGFVGSGDLQLELVDNDTITNGVFSLGFQNETGNGSFAGEVMHVAQVGPKVASIASAGATATVASWTVTFSEPVTGVNVNSFILSTTDVNVPDSGRSLTTSDNVVFVYSAAFTAAGPAAGSMQLSLYDLGAIHDSDGNPLHEVTGSADISQGSGLAPAISVATADLNNDGIPDFVMTGSDGDNVAVLLNTGDGTAFFKTQLATGANPRKVVVADFNGDGFPDLAVAAGNDMHTVSILLGNGDGTFQSKVDVGASNSQSYSSRELAVADVNGDGRLDLLNSVVVDSVPRVDVLLGTGSSFFIQGTSIDLGVDSNPSVTVGDLNGDHHPDFVVTSSLNVFLGAGNGTFVAGPVPAASLTDQPISVALADLNHDGKLDMVVADVSQSKVIVAFGAGDGSFSSSSAVDSPSLSGPASLVDFNGDGTLDIVAAIHDPFISTVRFGAGDGAFSSLQNAIAITRALVTGFGDFNGDHRVDFVSAGDTADSSLVLNTSFGYFAGDTINVPGLVVITPNLHVTTFTDSKTNVGPGELLTFAIGYSNDSTTGATGVKLTFPLSGDLSFVAKENPGWVKVGSSLVKTLPGTLDAHASGATKLKLHVNKTINNSGSGIFSTIVITDDGTHGSNEGGSAQDYDQLKSSFAPNMSVTVKDSDVVTPYGYDTYVVGYKNTGNLGAFSKIAVKLPNGTEGMVNDNGVAWTYDSQTGEYFTFKNIDAGAKGSLSFKIQVPLPSYDFEHHADVPLSLDAKITPFSITPDTNLANNQVTDKTPYYSGFYVTSPGAAIGNHFAPPVIRVFDRATGVEVRSFLAYEKNYRDSIRVAVGDLNGDGVDDIVTTTRGGTGRLRVFDGLAGGQFTDGPFSHEIAAFDGHRDRGAFVAVGDVNGDRFNDIVVGSALGGGKVKVFSGSFQRLSGHAEIQRIDLSNALGAPDPTSFSLSFGGESTMNFPVETVTASDLQDALNQLPTIRGSADYKSGSVVVSGNSETGFSVEFNSLGDKELLVASVKSRSDTPPPVDVIEEVAGTLNHIADGLPQVLKTFTPFGSGFKGGVRVAVADVNGSGFMRSMGNDSPGGGAEDIIVGQGYYGGGVKVYDGMSDTLLHSFSVGGKDYRGGVSVAAADLDGDRRADLIVGRNSGTPSSVEVFSGVDLHPIGTPIVPFSSNMMGVRVAAADVNSDGIADIITSVGVLNGSKLRVYDGHTHALLFSKVIYSDHPDVALWVAGSDSFLKLRA